MAQINKSTDYFNTGLYTGNDTDDHAITGVNFQPDFVWIKGRSSAVSPNLYDVIRGANKPLSSNGTNTEFTRTDALKSFDSDGFTLDDDATSDEVNNNGVTYASWNWLAGGTASENTDGSITSQVSANTTSGFSIVSWTADGTNNTVGHGLGQTPSIVIAKNRSATSNWDTITNVIDGSIDYLKLNLTDVKVDLTGYTLNSSVFSINYPNTNNIIAYCFAEKKGYSKFGSYTGNGSADGTFIYTGFKPAFTIIKNASAAYDWLAQDSTRQADANFDGNPVNILNQVNANNAESNASTRSVDYLSNGFKIRQNTAAWNTSGNTFIYMAFAENPLVGTNNIPATAR